jgi:hypothetical protein
MIFCCVILEAKGMELPNQLETIASGQIEYT